MPYFLILDSDYATIGQNVTIVSSSDDIGVLMHKRIYLPDSRTTIPAEDLAFVLVRQHDLIDVSVPGNPPVPAAIYRA
jgi:hypothetical protein